MNNLSFDELFKKIRINFLFNHPFFSVLALSLDTKYGQNKNSLFFTDGYEIIIDSSKIGDYSFEEITYLYAHTLLHIVLKHPFRKQQRDESFWNISSDIVVNLILNEFENIGTRPKEETLEFEYKDMSVEEVYEIIYKKKEEKKSSNSSKKDMSYSNEQQKSSDKEDKINNIIIQAITLAKKSSNLSEGFLVEINEVIKPQIDLFSILKEYMIQSMFEKNLTYKRANRKFVHKNIYLPGYENKVEQIVIYVALDCSSSVSLEEYKNFLGVIESICEGFYEYSIKVLPFDIKVHEEFIVEFSSFDLVEKGDFFIPKSNGGTNFDAVCEYLQEDINLNLNALLIVLSDGKFDITKDIPLETLFVLNSKKNLSRFEYYGRVVQFRV